MQVMGADCMENSCTQNLTHTLAVQENSNAQKITCTVSMQVVELAVREGEGGRELQTQSLTCAVGVQVMRAGCRHKVSPVL